MSRWEALYNASGLAASNTQLYVGLGILVYMYIAVYTLHWLYPKFEDEDESGNEVSRSGTSTNRSKKQRPLRWKVTKMKEEELKNRYFEDFMSCLQNDIRNGHLVS
jgi:hypothetical protein